MDGYLAVSDTPTRSEEFTLWVAVLELARSDSLGDIESHEAYRAARIEQEARRWWCEVDGAAEWICAALGLDREHLVEALARQWAARDLDRDLATARSDALRILTEGT